MEMHIILLKRKKSFRIIFLKNVEWQNFHIFIAKSWNIIIEAIEDPRLLSNKVNIVQLDDCHLKISMGSLLCKGDMSSDEVCNESPNWVLIVSSFKKLRSRANGPFKIAKWINDNAYKIDLYSDYYISSIFNVFKLSWYNEDLHIFDDEVKLLLPREDDIGVSMGKIMVRFGFGQFKP